MDHFSLIFNIIKFLFSPLLKVFNWIYNKLPFRVISKKRLPNLGIIESSYKDHMWSYGKQGHKEIIFINTYWQITNTRPYNLTAMNAFLTKPGYRIKGHILVKDTNSNTYGSFGISEGYTTEADISFITDIKYVKSAKDTIKVDILIQDAIGKTDRLKNIIVKPFPQGEPEQKEMLSIENPSKIKYKRLKQVISVLKNEVPQYKIRGRREGRLGTVEWPRGQMEWTIAGDMLQFLSDESRKASVTTEHIDALVKLFHQSTKAQQKLIVSALLERINKKNEYRDIGYLIFFFFFEVHQIKESLPIFTKKLQGDGANAFSDVLRMIDILLTFRYDEFSATELDELETFIYGTKEHPFRIKERINAIRVKNILGTKNKD
jgi:hypothetical protein